MSALRVSDAASADIDRALDYSARERPQMARRLLAAFRRAFELIEQSPGAGSPRYAAASGVSELRHRATKGFPYLVFYAAFDEAIFVLRVLHQRSDIEVELVEI